MEADGNISLFLPDGTVVLALPENRERTASLWLKVDSEVDLKMDRELIEDAMKIKKTTTAIVTEINQADLRNSAETTTNVETMTNNTVTVTYEPETMTNDPEIAIDELRRERELNAQLRRALQ